MIAALLKLVPFRDYAYAALGIAAVVWYNVHVHGLEVGYAAKQVTAVNAAYADASAKALSAAKKLLDAKDAQHAQDVAQIQEKANEDAKNSAAAHAADLQRLRQLAAQGNRQPNAVLPSAGGGSAPSGQGDTGAEGLGLVPAELGAELADALRTTRDQRDLCYADRDALTGK
jgi:hypothetical protein